MLKKVSIETAGSGSPIREGFVVTPETTAKELLTRAKLVDYQLCPTPDQLPFAANESVYEKVGDGSVLFAYREATAGEKSPALGKTSLCTRRGWANRNPWFYGYYRTKFGSFEGKARPRALHAADFYLRYPPEVLAEHPHWGCFHKKNNGWYSIHFQDYPETIDDGIKSIEELLISAFMRAC